MDKFNEEECVNLTIGIEESVDASKTRQVIQLKRSLVCVEEKFTSQVWIMFETLSLAEDRKKKRCT